MLAVDRADVDHVLGDLEDGIVVHFSAASPGNLRSYQC